MGFEMTGMSVKTYKDISSSSAELSIIRDSRYVFGTVTQIEIAEITDCIAVIYFTSGTPATNFIYPEGIMWKGDDCEDDIFIPTENRYYEVVLENVNGVTTGYTSAFEPGGAL